MEDEQLWNDFLLHNESYHINDTEMYSCWTNGWDIFALIGIPAIVLLGVLGSALTMSVFCQKRHRTTPSGVYINVMSVINAVYFVTFLVPVLMQKYFIWTYDWPAWTCFTDKLFSYILGHARTWLLVVFSCERTFAIVSPTRRSCIISGNTKNAVITSSIVIILSTVANLYLFGSWFQSDCFMNYYESEGQFIIHNAVECFIPFIILLITSAIIAHKLRMCRSSSSSTGQLLYMRFDATTSSLVPATEMATSICLASSIIFCLSVIFGATPNFILHMIQLNFRFDIHWACNMVIVSEVSFIFLYSLLSANILVYCLLSKQFRSELLAVFGVRSWCNRFNCIAMDTNERHDEGEVALVDVVNEEMQQNTGITPNDTNQEQWTHTV